MSTPSYNFQELLGNNLLARGEGSTSNSVSTTDALKGKAAVGLYFSGHWCGPCRSFTPALAKSYAKAKELGKEFEIVFVSSDRDQESFDSYHAEQPWLALPFEARDIKAKLSKKYKVSGIPSLVILDGASGEVITKDGRSSVSEDPEFASFPWKPPTLWEALGEEVLSGDGEDVSISSLRGAGKVLGLYFSAEWCPPCHAFTPKLAATYKALKAAGKDFEIIFVSSDRSAADFQKYFATMPWLAIPQGDKRKGALSKMFDVEGIPTFVMLDADTGKIINPNARGAVASDPQGENFPWTPPAVEDLASPDGINDELSLCVMMEGLSAEAQAAALATLTPLAEKSKAAGEEILFYAAKSDEGAVPQVRKLTNLGSAEGKVQLLLLDIPDNGGYYVGEAADELTADAVTSMLSAYRAGMLDRKQLG